MKQCPNCRNTYTDDTLQFCLEDGTPLISTANDAPPTVQMSFEKNEPMRVNIPNDSAPTVFAQPPVINNSSFQPNQPVEKKGFGLIIAGILGLLLLLVGGGLAAFLLIPRSGDGENSAVVKTTATPTATAAPSVSPTASPNDETAKLKEEMEKLKKQLENQKNQKSNSAISPTQPQPQPQPYDNGRTAYANSPGDGFLALRSEPSSESGERVAKIPHGAALTVIDCPRPSNAGKMPGRWCRVVYNGQQGWAFDKFMKF